MYRNMADYQDLDGVSCACFCSYVTGAVITVLNAIYSCFCALGTLFQFVCGCGQPSQKVKVSVIENGSRTHACNMITRQCSSKISTQPWMRTDEFRMLNNKVVWVVQYGEDGGVLNEEFDMISSRCKLEGKDILVIYAGVPVSFTCWCYQLFSSELGAQSDQRIAALIGRKRFLSVTNEYDLNCTQRCRLKEWAQELQLLGVSIVGFSTKTREQVCKFVQEHLPVESIHKVHLAKDADFKPEELNRKVLLLCSYTERNNIMVPRPDVGELTGVYEIVEARHVDVIVLYAGVPTSYEGCPRDGLYSPYFTRLLRSQAKLRGLMDTGRFMTVDTSYSLNRTQQARLKEWLMPDSSSGAHAQRVDTEYCSYP